MTPPRRSESDRREVRGAVWHQEMAARYEELVAQDRRLGLTATLRADQAMLVFHREQATICEAEGR